MAVEHLKSTPITNADATPPSANTAGEGGPGYLRSTEGYVTVPASASVDSTFQLVRLPSTAKVKSIIFESEAQTAGKVDLGVYRADLASYVAANATDQDFFATDIDCAAAVTPTEVVNESTTYTLAKRGQPLWQAVGLTENPNCMLDIVATVHTTAVTTGTGKLGVRVVWVD